MRCYSLWWSIVYTDMCVAMHHGWPIIFTDIRVAMHYGWPIIFTDRCVAMHYDDLLFIKIYALLCTMDDLLFFTDICVAMHYGWPIIFTDRCVAMYMYYGPGLWMVYYYTDRNVAMHYDDLLFLQIDALLCSMDDLPVAIQTDVLTLVTECLLRCLWMISP